MDLPEGLPDGLTVRPLALTDAPVVYELMVAQELHDVGEAYVEEADIVGDWQRPSCDLATSSIGVLDGETLVAYAELTHADRADAAVHPSYRRRGIGTALAGWVRERARERGARIVGSPVPLGSPGDRLLESLGYGERWRTWVLRLPEGREITSPPLPAGVTLRTATEAELRTVWEVKEEAFLEWSDREREPFGDWLATSVQRPGSEPWNIRVAVAPEGQVVGMCLVLLAEGTGYVDQLAVRRERRGQGLARALLVDAFTLTRAHGATVCELSTDSRTGALGLYERVGMEVVSEWVHRAVTL
jgi:ribosomal protein S18 acetylase RimI-like enzyme